MSDDKFAPELRFHHAIPKWCKLVGVKIREIPECEGSGYMVPEEQARMIVSSPGLLAALKGLAWNYRTPEGRMEMCWCAEPSYENNLRVHSGLCDAARAATAKAEERNDE